MPKVKYTRTGFTLAELLISLTILGVISSFTIPKVLSAQQAGKSNAVAKEAAAMVANAWSQAQMDGKIQIGSGIKDVTPYMNYVKVDTTTIIDDWQGSGAYGCSASLPCLVLHNGARMVYDPTDTYGALGSTNWIHVQVDADGTYSGSTTGPGKAIGFTMYATGRLTTDGIRTGVTTRDPTWFSWN